MMSSLSDLVLLVDWLFSEFRRECKSTAGCGAAATRRSIGAAISEANLAAAKMAA
jgi:hypothetical protein